MEFQTFLKLVGRKRKTIYGILALFLILAIGFIAVQRFKYSAESQLLVVQESRGFVDAYTASKSSEHLSSVLASVVSSNSFYTKVVTTSPSINTAYFGATPREQIREWGHTVKAQSINDSGIIAISVYHPDKTEAEKIAGAVNYVLMTEHSAYDGAGEAVKVRLIDQPISSSFPVKPNVPLILLTALVLGGVFSLMYIYLISESYRVITSPQNVVRSTEPEFNHFREEYFENPVQSGYSRPVTPFGERAQVNIQPQSSYNHPYDNRNIEDISYQGNMHNILG